MSVSVPTMKLPREFAVTVWPFTTKDGGAFGALLTRDGAGFVVSLTGGEFGAMLVLGEAGMTGTLAGGTTEGGGILEGLAMMVGGAIVVSDC